MRTTLRIEDHLLAQLRQSAAQSGRTITAIVEDALREWLARRVPPQKKQKIRLKAHGHGGLRPGVDLYDSAALLDLMDLDDAMED